MKFIIILFSLFVSSCSETFIIEHNNPQNLDDPILILFREFYGEKIVVTVSDTIIISQKIFYDKSDTTGISKEVYIERDKLINYTITVEGLEFYYEKPIPKNIIAISVLKTSKQIMSKSDISITFHTEPIEIA